MLFGKFTFRSIEVAATYATPTLSLLSSVVSPDPVFDIVVDDEFKAGHTIELQRDTSGAFGNPTTSSILMNSDRRSAANATHSLGPVSDGTYYYRARHVNNPYFSEWSSTISHTVAQVSAPVGITYVQGFTASRTSSVNNRGMFRDRLQLTREAASQNCYFVFAISGLVGIGGDTVGYTKAQVDMNNGAGPVAASIVAQSTYGSRHHVILFAVPVTSGNVANIEVFAGSTIFDYAICGGLLFNVSSITPTATQVVGPTSMANPVVTSSVTVPSGGMALAAFSVDQTGTNTWNNGFTKEGSAQGTNTVEIGTYYTPGSVTPSVTRTSTRTSCMAVAIIQGL